MVSKLVFQYVVLALLLTSCSTGGLKQRSQLRNLFLNQKYEDAHKLLDKSSAYKDEDLKLLYLLEKGLLYHHQGYYELSIKLFSDAKDLSEQLFTVSIKNKLQSVVANDTYDKYYGESYERSLIHFYLSLNRVLLSQRGFKYQKEKPEDKEYIKVEITKSEKSQLLYAARAEILAWDSVLEVYRQDKSGRSVFKNDLLAKVFGAYIHELIGSTNDLNTAYILYKDAKDLLFKNYNLYPTFNKDFLKFQSNFTKLHKMKRSVVAKKFVSKSIYYKNLESYLNEKIIELSFKVRKSEYRKYLKQFKISKTDAKKIIEPKNVKVILQNKLIPLKVAQKHYYTLNSVLNDPKKSKGVKALAAIGSTALTIFAADKLGLLPPPAGYTPLNVHLGVNTASILAGELGIKFELPAINTEKVNEEYYLEVYAGEKKITEVLIPLINPVGDLAQQSIKEHASLVYSKLGTRLAIKHITAIAASYATYKGLAGKGDANKFWAKNAAAIQYIAATKAIEASEKADTRYWSTLPFTINSVDLSLSPGKYSIKLKRKDLSNNHMTHFPQVYALEVLADSGKTFLNLKI